MVARDCFADARDAEGPWVHHAEGWERTAPYLPDIAGFRRFLENSGFNFQPHGVFLKADLDARQELFQQLAEHVRSTDRLERAAQS